MEEEIEYIKILKALKELPFHVGKNLLVDFLRGDYINKSISKNRLDELEMFSELSWDKGKILQEIDRLIANGMIELASSDYNKFIKVLFLTIKGNKEISHPTLKGNSLATKVKFTKTEISEEDKKNFEVFAEFLTDFNDEQKKAIISKSPHILCVAGAGSGKTTVLTKRVEFLVNLESIKSEKILAVTFTRKARQEMQKRLQKLGIENVQVHTFNSFCESILKKNEFKIYGRKTGVQSYGDKVLAMNMALASIGLDMGEILSRYYTPKQRKFKTSSQLANGFMNDCFSVMEYFKVTGEKEYDFSKKVENSEKNNAERVYKITNYLKEHMEIQGLRDYTDQLIDVVRFFNKFPSEIPSFEHILIDEYQDVNAIQINLLKLLNSPNIFAVGDPRQAIFGWRGSDINYIIDFEKDFPNSQIIHLVKNYRSSKEIVEFINDSIRIMGLPDLLAHNIFENANVQILNFETEDLERKFILKEILTAKTEPGEIFVLARTNRQLMELSQLLKQRGINHVVNTDEVRNPTASDREGVVLATVHAIKGLEAKKVFVMGVNDQNFPCKASDHPAIEMIKNQDYNREEEERRLLYVALSRAKENLLITYTGKKPSYFISDKMITNI